MGEKLLKEMDRKVAEITSQFLWRHKAVQVNEKEPFRLASGEFAPIYINCRLLISFPAARDILMGLARHLCQERSIECDCVAGGETAGIPFAAWLAEKLNKPLVYVRKKPKDYGGGRLLEGIAQGRVLLVEDLMTDGGSKIGFIEGIREAGCTVSDCLVIVDREQGGAEKLAEMGVSVHSLVGLSTCLEIGQASGLLSKDSFEEVKHYLEDPSAWNVKRGLSEAQKN
jgi:orotate phosphoribosyltransferase